MHKKFSLLLALTACCSFTARAADPAPTVVPPRPVVLQPQVALPTAPAVPAAESGAAETPRPAGKAKRKLAKKPAAKQKNPRARG